MERLPLGTQTGASRSLVSLANDVSIRTGARLHEEAIRASGSGIYASDTSVLPGSPSLISSDETESRQVPSLLRQFQQVLGALPLQTLRPLGDPHRHAAPIISAFRRIRISGIPADSLKALVPRVLQPRLDDTLT